MPLIHAPDVSTRLRNRYGIVGEGTVDTLAPELVPIAIVDDLREAQQSEDLECWAGHELNPSAAENAEHAFINPTVPGDVGRLVVITDLFFAGSNIGDVIVSVVRGTISGFTFRSSEFRDLFLEGTPGVTGLYSRSSAAGVEGTIVMVVRVSNENTLHIVNPNIIMAPETHLVIRREIADDTQRVSVFWNQRPLGR